MTILFPDPLGLDPRKWQLNQRTRYIFPVVATPNTMVDIRSTSSPHCYLCGKPGRLVHAQLEDKLFGAPGIWDLKECSGEECGLVWIDPAPLLEDLPKAYATYYTHDDGRQSVRSGRLRELYHQVKLAHLSNALGYRSKSVGRIAWLISKLLCFFPAWRRGIKAEVRFLPARSGGKLLDVGCGSGDWLEKMQRLGWTVSGIDFDDKAVRIAKERGLDVSCGTIPGIEFPSGTFDVVTLNHVIEHVPDPVAVLKESNRILKPGGKLVLATPNNACWGRRFFKGYWRGLEPPRHLHIFSPLSMQSTLKLAGFGTTSVSTLDSSYIWRLSLMIRFGLTRASGRDLRVAIANMMGTVFNFAEQIGLGFNPLAGECLLAIALKDEVPSQRE
jgi:2-polyprenyl-3-methyl-5-hydroxy-6-metoxy-1,4-benzoquinol methylase